MYTAKSSGFDHASLRDRTREGAEAARNQAVARPPRRPEPSRPLHGLDHVPDQKAGRLDDDGRPQHLPEPAHPVGVLRERNRSAHEQRNGRRRSHAHAAVQEAKTARQGG